MEPRAIPAATRGLKSCPHSRGVPTQPDSKTETEHDNGNNPERRKHLKSLVLGLEAATVIPFRRTYVTGNAR